MKVRASKKKPPLPHFRLSRRQRKTQNAIIYPLQRLMATGESGISNRYGEKEQSTQRKMVSTSNNTNGKQTYWCRQAWQWNFNTSYRKKTCTFRLWRTILLVFQTYTYMTFNSDNSSILGHGNNDHNVKLTNIIPSLLFSFECFCSREIHFYFQTESVSLRLTVHTYLSL